MEHYRNHGQTVIIADSSAIDTGILAIHLTNETVVTVKWAGQGEAVHHYHLRHEDWEQAWADGLSRESLGVLANSVKALAWEARREDGGEARHWHRMVMGYVDRGRTIAKREREEV